MPRRQDGVHKSGLMRREMPYRFFLPEDYSDSGLKYPVLYLLHGLFGSFENWAALTDLAFYASGHRLIVIMPEGENGWYTDGKDSGDKYESYLIHELIPAIDRRFHTIGNTGGRAIAGLSMGGYGAFKLALKFPQMFQFAASVSGAFDAPLWSDELPAPEWEEFRPSISRIFGDPGSNIRADNNIKEIIAGFSETEIAKLPFLYFDCGTDDGFIDANRKLSELFAKAGVIYVLQALPVWGDWRCWDKRGRYLLDGTTERLSRPMLSRSN